MELLHNESLKELLDSESFWVAVAFFIFITLIISLLMVP